MKEQRRLEEPLKANLGALSMTQIVTVAHYIWRLGMSHSTMEEVTCANITTQCKIFETEEHKHK